MRCRWPRPRCVVVRRLAAGMVAMAERRRAVVRHPSRARTCVSRR
jgi:hypothetical protein